MRRLRAGLPTVVSGVVSVVSRGRPWVELLEQGQFSAKTLALARPPSFQLRGPWTELLKAANSSWLSELLLGIAEACLPPRASPPFPLAEADS